MSLKNKLMLFTMVLLLAICPLFICGFFAFGINRSAEAITPSLKNLISNRGSYAYLVAYFDSDCKSNSKKFHSDIVKLQEAYPSSSMNTYVQGRIFTIYFNDDINSFSASGYDDFSIVAIPGMENKHQSAVVKEPVFNISYLGTALSESYTENGYKGLVDETYFYVSKSISSHFDDPVADYDFLLNNKEIKMKNGGVVGPTSSGQFDRSSEISKLCGENYMFLSFGLTKMLKQSSIVFELSNSRQIDYNHRSPGEDETTTLEPMSQILDSYIKDIVGFLNKYNYSKISLFKSTGGENTSVEKGTDELLNMETIINKYLSFYRNKKNTFVGVVFLILFILLFLVFFIVTHFLFKSDFRPLSNRKKVVIYLCSLSFFIALVAIIPPLLLRNMRFAGIDKILLFGQQYAAFLFFYFIGIMLFSLYFIKKSYKKHEIDNDVIG